MSRFVLKVLVKLILFMNLDTMYLNQAPSKLKTHGNHIVDKKNQNNLTMLLLSKCD